jgi:adenylate cyclase
MFDRWYRRLGARYPIAAVTAALRLQYVVFIVSTAMLAFYYSISLLEYAELALATVAGQSIYNVLTVRHFRRTVAPLEAWIEGDRSQAREAWEQAASVPYQVLRLWILGGYPAFTILLWAAFATWRLDQPFWIGPVLYAVAVVASVYSNFFNFFLLERAFRPVLDDIAATLPEDIRADAISLPLRRRLSLAVAGLNVITGVVVVGWAASGGGSHRLAHAVLYSVLMALTFSLGLSLLLASSVTTPIERLRRATDQVARGDLSVRVPVAASDEMGALTGAFNRMVGGLQERERLRDAFGSFVDPDLADRVARDGTNFEGEEVDLSVLFMDVRGFTTFSQRAPATEVVRRLNELYEVVVPVILRHGGIANKFIGDGLLAVFGAPERLADHADRAVVAAHEIAQCVRDRFADELRVGLGVNSGPAVVGTIGGGGRLDFTVIGDTVNTAARVESATRETGDDVLITAATRERLERGDLDLQELPAMPLKGKSEPVALYALRPSSAADGTPPVRST